MTKRKILDMTSTKKRDNMKTHDPANPLLNYFAFGRGSHYFLWCPTARGLDATGNTGSDREKSEVYYKGLRMQDEIGTNDGSPWRWRRIVFTTKGVHDDDTHAITSAGQVRLWKPQSTAAIAGTADAVFEGGTDDYSTYMSAKTSNRRVRILYDKIRTLRGGNDSAHVHVHSTYIPLEKTFTYDDDESGTSIESSVWSANNRYSLGDVFVWDMFSDGGAPEDAVLTIRGDATLYWHEK